eukprot:TRINITY_DN1125_c0_g1_i1.p1 TRINITY_DN1125_c0_g1~~TRINITY_DN1125_c0_g1_i1.p1  ORF type:complete len:425 (+),score=123.68 TRINITY_DN1125_c0_g1_i1:25-1275(+)
MAQNLFSLSQQAAAAGSDANRPAVSFRAGKCQYSSSTGTVTPIAQKGLIQVVQTPDQLTHFQWKNRTSGAVEDDLILFPDDATFQKVDSPAGRVYLLRFSSSDRRLFFWMQEPKDDQDKEHEKKVNHALNRPGQPMDQDPGAGESVPPAALSSVMQSPSLSRASPLAHQAPPTLQPRTAQTKPQPTPAPASTPPVSAPTATHVPPVTPSPAPVAQDSQADRMDVDDEDEAAALQAALSMSVGGASSTPAPSEDDEDDLQAALALSMGASQAAGHAPAPALAPSTSSAAPSITGDLFNPAFLQNMLAGLGGRPGEQVALDEVLAPGNVSSVLRDPSTQAVLLPLLPEACRTLDELYTLPRTPQYQQAVDVFESVLNSGQGRQLMQAFGLDPQDAGHHVGVQGFLEAIAKQADRNKRS